MRWYHGLAILTIAAPATAAPNAFWTFGFDLPRHGVHAPHFGEAERKSRLAMNGPAAVKGALDGDGGTVAASLPPDPARGKPVGS